MTDITVNSYLVRKQFPSCVSICVLSEDKIKNTLKKTKSPIKYKMTPKDIPIITRNPSNNSKITRIPDTGYDLIKKYNFRKIITLIIYQMKCFDSKDHKHLFV